jgi:hypothetical protein
MLYRPIGKTGMSASVIGLGAEHLDNRPYAVCEEVIDAALDAGISIIDIFMPGTTVREHIGRALRGRRGQVLLQGHIGSVDLREQYDRTRDVAACRLYFENFLRCLRTDYIDLGMMFFIDTEEDFREVFETAYLSYVLQLKQDGKIRAIGASCHDPAMAARLVATGIVEVLLFSVNPAYDLLPSDVYVIDLFDQNLRDAPLRGADPVRARLYTLCASQGVAITTMKTLGAGKLLSPDFSPFAQPLSVGQCIHYALTRPAVVSTLIGCRSRAEVREAVGYLELSEAERDYAAAISSFKGEWRNQCVYCNHCLPCPAQIDIAAMTRLLDTARLGSDSIPAALRAQYKAAAHPAADCTACGQCEARCPFHVGVIANMQETERILG